MGLYDAARLFGFEVESSDNLRFIPLAVRFNLDRFGMRIALEEWQQLPYEDRALLARFPVEDDAELEKNFDLALEEMLKTHANATPEQIERDTDPVWAHADAVPESVIRQSSLAGVSAPSLSRWGKLDRFQRYALAKLSRNADKLNHDFLPAMREFGLTE
ncbi:nitrate reductase associated protein [Caballeronia sp. LP006]|uniref:nitrate reductase associated protein n=1 Tax=unclassified Caballeronia TaxID=2646786 RepID=UPI001FD4210A|nr:MULTISPECIES: nitrate reductase associated protein [unclassified Caballeronia]MDR5770483.1 nitrate reductase associated protein [Caballeronia sp. LZ002]MDR5803117.1 nitrate reductase associated protein [Caballeronia sp. LZ001]MDR5830229.1 nitrate reductase associated protein [Caballeronia sp. LP006]MDR5845920.1 nitrate reductase associated protein [Caballeronia sp. LZ003]